MESKYIGGHVLEVKQEDRNGVPVGIVSGYIAAWTPDQGGFFGVPDRFHPGAFLKSIEDHRRRNNRQIRLRDHHGRTVGGFPIDTVREDSIGLFGDGEINLEVQQGREAHSLARQKVLTDFSIGFISKNDKINGDIRDIFEADIFEGSIVDEPMNRNATITEVKSLIDDIMHRIKQYNSQTDAKSSLILVDVVEDISIEALDNMSARQIEQALLSHSKFSKKAAKVLACKINGISDNEMSLSDVLTEIKNIKV